MNNMHPPVRVDLCDAARREPGIFYFTTRPGGARDRVPIGWLVGIGGDGNVVFDQLFDGTSQDVRCQPDGSILFSLSAQGLLLEVQKDGRVTATWHARGKWRDREPPAGSVELPVEHMHHTVNVTPNGNFLILDAEARSFEGWPTDTLDPDAARANATIVGDVVTEVTRDGRLVHAHRLLDILDPYRITHGSLDSYWQKQGFPGAYDWSHANAVTHDPNDDSLIVSVRHQDCMIKIGRSDGRLKWILGNHGGWREPWRDMLLKPEGNLRWQYHQHDCSVTGRGRVLCFDNGNFRAPAFQPPHQHASNFSRAVEFEVDEAARTVRQIWEFGEERDAPLYACYQGGALRLPRTGNTLITFGGMCFENGAPSGSNIGAFGQAKIIEVTPTKDVVLELTIVDEASEAPKAFSAFRSSHQSAG